MSDWIKFTGSDEQIEECRNAHNGWFIKTSEGKEMYCSMPAHPFTAYPDLRIRGISNLRTPPPQRHDHRVGKDWEAGLLQGL